MLERYESIHEATSSGDYQAVEAFLKQGIPVDLLNEHKETPLMLAARWGHDEIVELCLKNKAYVSFNTLDSNTALSIACMNGKSHIVKQLLEAKADIEHKNKYGYNCLLSAAFSGESEMVQVLLEHNANIHETNPHRSTPLLEAVVAGKSAETIETLILYGANVNLGDDSGWTPLKSAYKEHPSLSNVFMLLLYGAVISDFSEFTQLFKFLQDHKKEWQNNSDDLSELFQLFVAMDIFCNQLRIYRVSELAIMSGSFLEIDLMHYQEKVKEFKKTFNESIPITEKNIGKISLEYLGFFHKKNFKYGKNTELKSAPKTSSLPLKT